jgi:hypothetical protein
MDEAERHDVNGMKRRNWRGLLIIGANRVRTGVLCTSERLISSLMEVYFYGDGPYENENHPTTFFKDL